MASRFGEFMLGLIVTISQASLFGMIAYWLGSRRRRITRILGAIFILFTTWLSVVVLIDRFAGILRGDIDSNLAVIFALMVGWLGGRMNRLSVIAQTSGTPRGMSVLDRITPPLGSAIAAFSQIYGAVGGLFAFFVVLAIVSDLAGFWGVVIGVTILPVTFTVAPIYVGFKYHNWMPAAFCYGSILTTFLGYSFGKLVANEPLSD